MAKISNAAKRRHLETGGRSVAPTARSDADNLEYEDLSQVENGLIEQRVRCTKCSRRWMDVFALTDVRELAGKPTPDAGRRSRRRRTATTGRWKPRSTPRRTSGRRATRIS